MEAHLSDAHGLAGWDDEFVAEHWPGMVGLDGRLDWDAIHARDHAEGLADHELHPADLWAQSP
jgi:hypothetical protein